jgi:basic amino acid/polyamine antiporter, APA family
VLNKNILILQQRRNYCMAFYRSLFQTKPFQDHAHNHVGLRRCLTAGDLTLLGIGAIIGAGVFVLTGFAATQAGPAIIFSYILAAMVCGFNALAYAELASSVGGCGSAYGYAYSVLGELIAWMVGWDLLLAYGMNAVTVSIGWSAYFTEALHALGLNLPKSLCADPAHGGIINLPAMFIILIIAKILATGVKESARFNKIIVFIKLSVIALFIGLGSMHFNPSNWSPFVPFGLQGVVSGAGLIFFAYIGFDTLSTAAEEAINPKRDLPISIIVSLSICTLIYILVAGVLTGIMYYPSLNVGSPVATSLLKLGYHVAAEIVAIGAIAGLTTTILVLYYGSTRIFLAMARDGLLPAKIAKIDPKSHTPRQLVWAMGYTFALAAGVLPINRLAEFVNFGVLAAFCIVSICVIVLRYTKPHIPRPFKTPWSPLIPILGILSCFYLMKSLSAITWLSFIVWTVIGLVFYFKYSRANSVVINQNAVMQGNG